MAKKIILASRSPRKKNILKNAGISFDTISVSIDETPVKDFSITEQLKEISMRKALAAMQVTENLGSRIIVASKQNIVFKDQIYGRPHTIEEARSFIKNMEGSNEIYSYVGNAILDISDTNNIIKLSNECDIAILRMVYIPDEVLENYLKSQSPLDKCGGISIFDTPFLFLEDGRKSTAGGLTVENLFKMLN